MSIRKITNLILNCFEHFFLYSYWLHFYFESFAINNSNVAIVIIKMKINENHGGNFMMLECNNQKLL